MNYENLLLNEKRVIAEINGNQYDIDFVFNISDNSEHVYITSKRELNEVINDYHDLKSSYRLTISVPNFDNIIWRTKEHKEYDVKIIFEDGEKYLRLGLCGGTAIENKDHIDIMCDMTLGAEFNIKEQIIKVCDTKPNGYLYK